MTRQPIADIEVPAEFAEPLRRAAREVRGGPPELTEVLRRRRRSQMRRSAITLAGVGVLVAASIVTPRLLTGPAAPVESAGPASPTPAPPTPPPAQRLFVVAASVVSIPQREGEATPEMPERPDPSLPNLGFPPGAVGVLGSPLEVTASGQRVPLDIPTVEPGGVVNGFQFLPDGRLATLEFVSLSDEDRRDGPCITDAAIYLHIIERDGSVSTARDLRTPCESIRLIGASADEAFLVRSPHDPDSQASIPGRRLVAHRLIDGAERTVTDLDGVYEEIFEVSLGSGSLVASDPWPGDCGLRVVEFAGGVLRGMDVRTAVPDCHAVTGARVSPGGGRLAVSVTTGDGVSVPHRGKLAIIDISLPGLGQRGLVTSVDVDTPTSLPLAAPAGMAWADESTLRVAWARYPQDLDRVVMIDEILDVHTYAVP